MVLFNVPPVVIICTTFVFRAKTKNNESVHSQWAFSVTGKIIIVLVDILTANIFKGKFSQVHCVILISTANIIIFFI